MALSKSIILDNGIETNYHRISFVGLLCRQRQDVIEGKESETGEPVYGDFYPTYELSIELSSYVSADARNSNMGHYVHVFQHDFDITEEEANSNLRDVGYKYLKTLDQYEDSEDC